MSSPSFLQELAMLAADGVVDVSIIQRLHRLHNEELNLRESDILVLASGTSKKTDEQKEMVENLLLVLRVLFSKCQIQFPTVDNQNILHTAAKPKRVQIISKAFEDLGKSNELARTIEALLGKTE